VAYRFKRERVSPPAELLVREGNEPDAFSSTVRARRAPDAREHC
jgi:hypothetical protein